MLNEMKVHVIGGNQAIEYIFRNKGASIVSSLDKADTVVWTGGADVDPKLYGEDKHPKTHMEPQRDKFEQACWFRAQEKGKFCVGICRGGQFLNVMNGGTLWQHVDGHAMGDHIMNYRVKHQNGAEVRQFLVTSTHHQQMIPNVKKGVQREVWGFAGLSTIKESGIWLKKEGKRFIFQPSPGHSSDAEIVWYPGTRSLCFQPHPEYTSQSTRDLFFMCIERALTV